MTIALFPLLIGAVVCIFAYLRGSNSGHKNVYYSDRLPLINREIGAKLKFLFSARAIMARGRREYPGQPYRLITDTGEAVMLPPELGEEVRNHPHCSFSKAADTDFENELFGWDGRNYETDADQLLQTVGRKQLTKQIGALLPAMVDEASVAIAEHIGTSTEWHEIHIRPKLVKIVARLGSRAFLGEPLCCNQDWLRITEEFTGTFFWSTTLQRLVPWCLRGISRRLLPPCRKVRALALEARQLIEAVLAARRRAAEDDAAAGAPPPVYNDVLAWLKKEAGGKPFNIAAVQLALSLAATQTTTDLTQQVMTDIATHPGALAPLRAEAVRVLGARGWTQAALADLKLLDSAIKETQRLKPIEMASMRRFVTEDVTLSTGLVLPQGTRFYVDTCRMRDPTCYPEPDRWRPFRFAGMCASGEQQGVHTPLVSTSIDHMGFGVGLHSCPGRFFASTEVKMLMCYMLINYEWKLAPGCEAKPMEVGINSTANVNARMLVRARSQVEIDLNILER